MRSEAATVKKSAPGGTRLVDRTFQFSLKPWAIWLPNQELLKRCALYTTDVVIDDPLFKLTLPKNEQSEAYGSPYMGIPKSEEFRSRGLARAATYIYKLRAGIAAGFIRMLPVSYLHEPPEHIPFTSSENGFADILPSELLAWFRENAQVLPLIETGKGLAI